MTFAALDPNWFYSTLAQSTAAIVGLAGGFLVQRILAHRSDIAPQRAQLRKELMDFHREVEQEAEFARRVASAMQLGLDEIAKLREEGRQDLELRSEFFFSFTHRWADWSGMLPPPEHIDQAEPQLKDLQRAASDYLAILPEEEWEFLGQFERNHGFDPDRTRSPWLTDPNDAGPLPHDPQPDNFWRYMGAQRNAILARWNKLWEKSFEVGDKLMQLEFRLLPASLWLLLVVLGGLLVAGVIAPLFFLSAKGGPSKAILLAVIVPLAAGFLAYLAWELARIRGAADMTEEHF